MKIDIKRKKYQWTTSPEVLPKNSHTNFLKTSLLFKSVNGKHFLSQFDFLIFARIFWDLWGKFWRMRTTYTHTHPDT